MKPGGPTVVVVEREEFTANVKLVFGDEAGITLEDVVAPPTIKSVESGSPADKAGLKPGDQISAVGEEEVETKAETSEAITSFVKTNAFDIKVKRAREEIPLAIVPTQVAGAPLMGAIVPLIFIFFVIPGLFTVTFPANSKAIVKSLKAWQDDGNDGLLPGTGLLCGLVH